MTDNTKRMLYVLAHPDDESFGSAGAIARYVAEGVEVSLICTTNGDVGTVAPEFMEGFESISEVRLSELKCAAEVLQLKNVYTFGYRDSGMAGTEDNKHPEALTSSDPDKVVERITRILRELRPHVVVTFDPYGGYGHPDHIVTHNATVEAFHAAADPSRYPQQFKDGLKPYQAQKLYFATFDRSWMKFTLSVAQLMFVDVRHMGRNKDINAWEIANHSFPIHATINTGPYQLIADQARNCHASQLGGVGPRRLTESVSRLFFGVQEQFMRAYPPVNGRVREHDLFEGVKTD
jgi:LmbE family N-acetylglucosaminyl deacetylase